jgi:regulator of cell morphogenesis and NO signaling
MNITENTKIADIAAKIPASVRVFQRHGLDFCCGGGKPLASAGGELGLSVDEVTREIEAAAAGAPTVDRDWNSAPLHDLTRHIVSTYHDPLIQELPRLESMAVRVARVHGLKAPQLLGRIEAIVRELSADLSQHMRKEEAVLFPLIGQIERGDRPQLPVAGAIRVMTLEHDHAGDLLHELRQLTDGYTLPEWACATVRALYQGLAELEETMHVPVHLENNVLFPRALALIATH